MNVLKILKTFLSRPRPRLWVSRPRPRPRLYFLSSRRLETKTLVSRTTYITGSRLLSRYSCPPPTPHRRRFWHATQDCVAPYDDHILHRDRFWAISIASGKGSVRLWDFSSQILLYGAQPCDAGGGASSWSPPVLLESRWRVNRILLAFAISLSHWCHAKRVEATLLDYCKFAMNWVVT